MGAINDLVGYPATGLNAADDCAAHRVAVSRCRRTHCFLAVLIDILSDVLLSEPASWLLRPPAIQVVLVRNLLFAFFISVLPALMPVVGLKKLHLQRCESRGIIATVLHGRRQGLTDSVLVSAKRVQ